MTEVELCIIILKQIDPGRFKTEQKSVHCKQYLLSLTSQPARIQKSSKPIPF